MKRSTVALMAGASLTPMVGCHSPNAELIRLAQTAITGELPAGATPRFTEVRVSPNSTAAQIGIVCGRVNGLRFLYGRDSGMHQIEHLAAEGDSDDLRLNRTLFDQTWRESC